MKPLVGISACLIGEKVRYDGGHKHQPNLIEDLRKHFELRPICPEVSIGLSVPREKIHLMENGDVLSSDGQENYGPALRELAEGFLRQNPDLKGFVFKSKSPSCGVNSAEVRSQMSGPGVYLETGAFAQIITKKSNIIFAEESQLIRLEDRQEFVSRIISGASN